MNKIERTNKRKKRKRSVKANLQRFTWGSKNLTDMSKTRTKYINTLKEADNYNILPLQEFAKS